MIWEESCRGINTVYGSLKDFLETSSTSALGFLTIAAPIPRPLWVCLFSDLEIEGLLSQFFCYSGTFFGLCHFAGSFCVPTGRIFICLLITSIAVCSWAFYFEV